MAANGLIFKDAELARNAIIEAQKREIAKLYDDWANDIGDRANYYKRKTNSSSWVSEMQMKELQKQLRATSQEVSNEVYNKIKSNMYTVADSVVQCNAKWLSQFGFEEKGINAAFSSVQDSVIRNIVTGQIYDSGWSLSQRIWDDNEQTLKDIYQVVAKGMAENMPMYDIAKNLEKYVRPNAQLPWNLRMADGKKIYKKHVDYNAQRLGRTLVQHGYQQSFIATTQKNPFILGYIWVSNGSRVCELCAERDGQHFAKDQLPMDHPNGMCTMEPDVADNIVDQLADWFNSPDGIYPEIDNFAKDFGYSSKVSAGSILSNYNITSKFNNEQMKNIENAINFCENIYGTETRKLLKEISMDNPENLRNYEAYYSQYNKGIYLDKAMAMSKDVDNMVSKETIIHEFTHAVASKFENGGKKALGYNRTVKDVAQQVRKEIFADAGIKFTKDNVNKYVTEYATTNADEFLAECMMKISINPAEAKSNPILNSAEKIILEKWKIISKTLK